MASLFVDPQSEAMQAYNQLQSSDPATAQIINQIASQPQAVWLYGDGNSLTAAEQATYNAASAGTYPIFVPFALLALPAPDYPAWIANFAQVISVLDSAVVVEPNVLPQFLTQYASVISDSVDSLKASGKTRVYLDAGHAAWRPAAQMADTLNVAGIAKADGFAINVGNFRSTAECIQYGQAISGMVNKPYIIDTGRNGQGPPSDVTQICNPPGRGLGFSPAWDVDRAQYPQLDAYLWIKRPGESDGNGDGCFGGPAHGQWFQDYAVGLVNNRPNPQT